MKLALLLMAPIAAFSATPEVTLQPLPQGGYQPDLAVASDGTIHLIYHTGDPTAADILHTTYAPDTRTFTPPTRVNSTPGAAVPAGTVRGAQLAIGKADSLHIAWMGSAKTTSDGDHSKTPMLYTRSLDRGKSFDNQANLITKHYGLDGGGTITADKQNVSVVWHANGDTPGPDARQIIIRDSDDSGTSFNVDTPLGGSSGVGACPCCGIRAFSDPSRGRVLLLARGATGGQRDALLISYTLGEIGGEILMRSPWTTDTCPMSTSAFATNGKAIAVAWEQQERIRIATGDDRVHPVDLPPTDSPQKHPALALAADGSFLLAWVKPAGWGKPGTLHWQHYDSSGKPTATRDKKNVPLPVWSRPALAQTTSGITLIY